MKFNVTHFNSPQIALEELEPYVRDGRHLYTGKPFKRFGGLRSWELLANWLICALLNAGNPRSPFTFTTDPQGGDGILYDRESATGWLTEHVVVPKPTPGDVRDITALIVDTVAAKQAKGEAAYVPGKVLVVFLDAGLGEWFSNMVAQQLPKVDFDEVWVAGLHGKVRDQHVYGITQPDLRGGNSPVCLVRIGRDFSDWEVERLQ